MANASSSPLEQVVGAIWDLRDHAYDHPDQWKSVEAVAIFQVMGEAIGAALAAGQDVDWLRFPMVVQGALVGGPPPA